MGLLLGRAEPVHDIVRVPPRGRRPFAGLLQLGQGVGPGGVEQPVVRARTRDLGRDQRLRDQLRQPAQDMGFGQFASSGDGLRGVQRELPRKDGKPPQ